MPEPKRPTQGPPPTHPFHLLYLSKEQTRRTGASPRSNLALRKLGHRPACRPNPNDRAGNAYLGRVADGFKALFLDLARSIAPEPSFG
jgi:hypothetical protein